MSELSDRGKRAVMIGLLAICSALTYYFLVIAKTDIIYTHLFYIPIILAAVWWGYFSLVIAVLLITQLFAIHLIVDKAPACIINDIFRASMFVVIAVFTSGLSENIRKSRIILNKALEEAEIKVKDRASEISEMSQQLLEEARVRRQVEKDMEIFRIVADESAQGFGMADIAGNITYANKALIKIFGEDSREAVLKKNIFDYYPKSSHERVRNEVLPIILKGGNWQGEAEIVSAKGKISNVIENIFLVRDESGRPQFLANIVNDITERKKIQDELSKRVYELEEFSRCIVDRELKMQELENKIRSLEKRSRPV